MISVKGTRISFRLKNGRTLGLPPSYAMIHDEEGSELDACTLFFGPIKDDGAFDGDPGGRVRSYFGNDYSLRVCRFDLPAKRWSSWHVVSEILYFRPGKYESDFVHTFDGPQPLERSGHWSRLVLPSDCLANWKGIVRP